MDIIWSDDAKLDFEKNIEYLLMDWSEKSASKFIEEVELVLELLKVNPNLYPKVGYKTIRRAVVRKQITLYYQYNDSSYPFLEYKQRP